MSRSRLVPIATAVLIAIALALALALAWWGWHHLDAAQLLLGSRLC
ncbi:MAG: hypothetical protein RI841_09700 [Halomonas sp.]|nr:hypothetical protein [Halomonas sp.]MDR9439755.1 hypothetical protein [Halomonas sp.]